MFKLRKYQKEADEDIDEFLFNSSHRKGILVSPVGTGKAWYTAMIANKVDEPVLVIQPNKELLEQNYLKAIEIGLKPTIYSSSMKSKEISNLTYATPMSIVDNLEDFKHFEVVIIDECHMMMSNKLKSGKVSDKGRLSQFLEDVNVKKVIGLTATPIQLVPTMNGSELKMMNRSMRSFWYKAEIFHVTQIPDIHEEFWADITTEIETTDKSKLRLNSTKNDFIIDSVVNQYDYNKTEDKILEKFDYLLKSGISSVLIFVPSIEHAVSLSKRRNDICIVHGKTPIKERNEIVAKFKSKEIKAIVNVDVFSVGFDFPELGGIILARETNSFTVYYQIFGRLVRPVIINGEIVPTKKIMIDLTFNTNRFGDVRSITIEKNDYSNGWAMWNGNMIMTGYPFGDWDMPTRDSLLKKIKKGIISKNENIDDIILSFGKYKNKSIVKSFEKDPAYFIWVYNNVEMDKPWTEIIKKPLEKLIDKHIMHGK